MAIMYYGLVYSIAEMSPALPHTGGAYSFARSAMGPWGGFLTGLAENMEYVITPAVVVGAMGLLMQQIVVGLFEVGGTFAADGSIIDIAWWNSLPFWWALFYVIFVGINIIGIEATMKFTVAITVLSLVVLGFFFIAALVSGKFDPGLWTNLPKDGVAAPTSSRAVEGHFSVRYRRAFKALPFAVWFFLAIEEVPLAAEESIVPPTRRPQRLGARDGPALVIAAALTLFITGQVLRVKHKGGVHKIIVGQDALIVSNIPGGPADLKAGVAITSGRPK